MGVIGSIICLCTAVCWGSSDHRPAPAPFPATQVPDSSVTAVVPEEGATVTLAGVGRVVFPPGAFPDSQQVTVYISGAPQTEEGRTRWDVSVGSPHPASYDVRISTGDRAPRDSLEVTLRVPDQYIRTLSDGRAPHAFARVVSGGEMEDLDLYEVLESDFDDGRGELRVVVPPEVVRPGSGSTGFLIILLVGSVGR